jgi:two-component system, sensor histidine kinase LadS
MSTIGKKWRNLYLALVYLLLHPCAAGAAETVFYQGNDTIDLSNRYEVLYDPSGQVDFKQIMDSGAFIPSDGKPANFGLGPGNVWGRVRVDLTGTPQPERWHFVWNLTFIDSADVYVVDDSGAVLAHGRMGLFVGRPDDNAIYDWFDVSAFTNRPFTLYVRNDSRYSLRLNSLLMTEKGNGRMEAEATLSNALLAGTLGVTAAMFVGLGTVFLSRVYLYGGAVAFLLAWTNLMVSGLNRPLGITISPGDDWALAQIPIMSVNVVLPLFIAAYCDTARNWPRLYALLRAFGALVLVGLAAVVVFWPYQALSAGFFGFCVACVAMLGLALGDPKVERPLRIAIITSIAPFMILTILHLTAFNGLAPDLLPFEGLYQHFLDFAFATLVVGFIVATAYRTKYCLEEVIDQRTADLREAKKTAELSLKGEQEARQRLHTFIQMATHEFKTPLAIIDSSAQVLELLSEPDNREIGKRLVEIRASVRRITGLTDVCLAGERYEKLRASFIPIAPTAFLQQTLERNQGRVGGRLTLSMENLPEECIADSGLLGIALDALIDNANRYGGKNTPIELGGRATPTTLVFTVSDHGNGVAPELVGRIFEKYFRAESSRGIPGTGIGLHLVKEVAHLHDGDAGYAHRPQGGSVFSLSVPRNLEEN